MIRTAFAMALVAAACSSPVAAGVGATAYARWSMDPNVGAFPDGNPQTLDSRTASGEGVAPGFKFVADSVDNLFFNNSGASDAYMTSSDVPPASMFRAGQSGGSHSYDAAMSVSLTDADGGLYYPSDLYGFEFGFQSAFAVEFFFKTDGDQSAGGVMQLMLQAEGFFRYSLVLNEAGPGSVRFAVNDGEGTIFTVDMAQQNYADGAWHYVLATYDPAAGANGQISLSVANENMTSFTQTRDLPVSWMGFPVDLGDGNMFLGMEDFTLAEDGQPRRFVGLMDEVQIWSGIPGASERLGLLPGPPMTAGNVLARWSMETAPGLPDPPFGANPVTLDSRTAPAEAGNNHLYSFNGLPGGAYSTSADVPPIGMFDNGNDGGLESYDASALASVDGALLYPQDVYGDVFSFTDAFSVEMFFKTNGDQSGAGVMQLLNQGESFFRYGVIMNEAGPGSVRFALNDGEGVLPTVDLLSRNYADGQWHYLLATYDPSVGDNGELTLTIASADGTSETKGVLVPTSFAGLPTGNDSNMFIGRNTYPVGGDPRTFLGLIDEVQITDGIVDSSDRLGLIPTPTPPDGPFARWSMDPAPGLPMPANGANPVTLDLLTDPVSQSGFNHLSMFNGLVGGAYTTSADVAPVGMFDNGNSGGAASYDASAIAFVDGSLLYPQDVYLNRFAFTGAFSVEMFFKTSGDQSGAGNMQLLLQGEAFFRYALIVNEAGPGSVRFALNDGVGTIPLADIAARNYADGQWHYLLATYDPSAGANGELTLTIANEDGTADVVTTSIDPAFAGLPVGNDGNMLIGRSDFGVGGDPRTFIGLIDEIQISRGIVGEEDRIGLIPSAPACPGDANGDLMVNFDDLNLVLANWATNQTPGENGDVDGSGFVDFGDLNLVLGFWNTNCN